MADVSSRPRGGGSTRAGRGGRTSRGGSTRSTARHTNGDALTADETLEDQGELGQLKKQYMTQLVTLRDVFPDWTDEDLVFALQETDGDVQTTIERITEGNLSKFSDVKKKTKEKTKTKPTEAGTVSKDLPAGSGRSRGRGGIESARGGRGRGVERGRSTGRGGRGTSVSTHAPKTSTTQTSVPTTEASGWDSTTANTTSNDTSWDQTATSKDAGQWGSVIASGTTPATASEGQKSSLIPQGATKSWASMLKPVATVPQPPTASAPAAEPLSEEMMSTMEQPPPQIIESMITPPAALQSLEPDALATPTGSGADLTPPKDKLTEDNLEYLPDESMPAATETTASTRDPRSAAGSVTPYGAAQQAPISRPPMGGYATTAWKAAGMPGRSASFQKRMMEQREAVVMPSNHAIDRTAVQFGQMGLNGEGKTIDVDDDREEAETRAQPPQQSPPSQPRASLPPTAPQGMLLEQQMQDNLPTPKQAPGLPIPSHHQQPSPISNQPISQPPLGPQGMAQSGYQPGQQYGQYARYGQNSLGSDSSAPIQKPYDPFSGQLNYPQSQAEQQTMYPTVSQAPGSSQHQTQSQAPGYGQTPSEYGSQFTGDQQRNAYQSLYSGSYGQPTSANQQDQNAPPQRSTSGLGSVETGHGSGQTSQLPSRFVDSHNSGNNTPNPSNPSQQQMGSSAQQQSHMIPQQQQQSHSQTGHSGYPYGSSPYYGGGYSSYGQYVNQYPSQSYYQQNYGAPFGGKGGMYNQPHHAYGMPSQSSYEHSSSPANAGGYGSSSMQSRDTFSGLGGEYGRSGSAQQAHGQQSSSAFGGGMNDSYGRGNSGYQHSASQYGATSAAANEDSLKAVQEPKTGPSPLLGQPGRPASGINSAGQSGNQSGFPPPQSQQQGYGGYPSHLNQPQSNQAGQYGGGVGGLGSHLGSSQGHQSGGYGGYGSGFSNNYGGSYGGRGGWGGNYGGH